MSNGSGMPIHPWEQFMSNVYEFSDKILHNMGNILWMVVTVVFIFVAARVVLAVISRLTSRTMRDTRYHQTEDQGKRVNTMMTLVRSLSRYGVYFIAVMAILRRMGLGQDLIAMAGIGSFALGFGAQSMVKDVINGFFMLFENQFSVGDYVRIGEDTGYVEAIAMRVTYLRSYKGEQIIIPNGMITRVVNYTRGGYLAMVSVLTPYEADTREVAALLERAATEYAAQHADVFEGLPYVRGVTAFTPRGVEISLAAQVKTMKNWETERGLRLALKEAMDAAGIPVPYPHWEQLEKRAPAGGFQAQPIPVQEEASAREATFAGETASVREDSQAQGDSPLSGQ